MQIREYLKALARGKYLILASVIFCTSGAYLFDIAGVPKWEMRVKFDPLIRSLSSGYYDNYLKTSETVIKINAEYELSSIVDAEKSAFATLDVGKKILFVSGSNPFNLEHQAKELAKSIVDEATANAVFDMNVWSNFIERQEDINAAEVLIVRKMHADKFFAELEKTNVIFQLHFGEIENIAKRFRYSSHTIILVGLVTGVFLGLLLAMLQHELRLKRP